MSAKMTARPEPSNDFAVRKRDGAEAVGPQLEVAAVPDAAPFFGRDVDDATARPSFSVNGRASCSGKIVDAERLSAAGGM